jgi:hypothetical protein
MRRLLTRTTAPRTICLSVAVKVFLCGGAASDELEKFRIDLARQSRKIVTKPPPPTSPPKRVDVIHVRVCRTPKKR